MLVVQQPASNLSWALWSRGFPAPRQCAPPLKLQPEITIAVFQDRIGTLKF